MVHVADFLKNAQATLHHQPQLPTRPARHPRGQRQALQHQRFGPTAQAANQVACRRAVGGGRQFACADPMRLQVSQRHVVAAARAVHAQVLPEVDELQRAADGVGLLQRHAVVDAVQVQQQPAHRVGRAAAVVQQGGAVGVVGVAHVLLKRVEQGLQQGQRQGVTLHLHPERGKLGLPARAGRVGPGGGMQVAPVLRQVGQADLWAGAAFVRQVVGRACKVVDGGHRRPQRRWAQQRGDGKVFIVLHAHGVRF